MQHYKISLEGRKSLPIHLVNGDGSYTTVPITIDGIIFSFDEGGYFHRRNEYGIYALFGKMPLVTVKPYTAFKYESSVETTSELRFLPVSSRNTGRNEIIVGDLSNKSLTNLFRFFKGLTPESFILQSSKQREIVEKSLPKLVEMFKPEEIRLEEERERELTALRQECQSLKERIDWLESERKKDLRFLNSLNETLPLIYEVNEKGGSGSRRKVRELLEKIAEFDFDDDTNEWRVFLPH